MTWNWKSECIYRWMGLMILFSRFMAPKLEREKRSRRRPAGGYTATRCSTLEGTANREEKDRERFSGSTHAVPSSKFCA
jgi:hypothetical protein